MIKVFLSLKVYLIKLVNEIFYRLEKVSKLRVYDYVKATYLIVIFYISPLLQFFYKPNYCYF